MVKRYYVDEGYTVEGMEMVESPNGAWVEYNDYAALLARAEAAEKERDALKSDNERMKLDIGSLQIRIERAEAMRNDALGKRIAATVSAKDAVTAMLSSIVTTDTEEILFNERERVRKSLAEAVEYLDRNDMNRIESESLLHQSMRAALNGGGE